MKQAATKQLFSYWESLRSGTGCEDADAGLLTGTFLIEADARGAYPLRVVGDGLKRVTSTARLGASFLDFWDTTSRPLLGTMLRAVHEDGAPVVLGVLAHEFGQLSSPLEILLLPLSAGSEAPPRILGGLTSHAPGAAKPSRRSFSIVSGRAMHGLACRKAADAGDAPAASPPQLPAWLRVIDGGRSFSQV